MNQDAEHLRLLSIFHYVVAGLGAMCSCLPCFHLAFGLVILFAPQTFEHGGHGGQPPDEMPAFVGALIAMFAAVFILVGWAASFCVFLAGRYLSRRQHYTFCLVIAALLCAFGPFGTVLGVFTIIVLMRPSVKVLFNPQASQQAGGVSPFAT
jgi:hypothetical protein